MVKAVELTSPNGRIEIIVVSITLFFAAALLEIGGGYLVWKGEIHACLITCYFDK
jgi:hypothetical protein